MTIYLDIIFLENLCMNYIILYATAIITKTKPKIIRILIASIIGAIYAIVVVLNILEIYSNIFFKFLISIIIVYLALETKNIKNLVKNIIIFYLTSFTFGGVALALLYFVKPENILMRNGVYVGTYPIKIAFMGGILGFIIITVAFSVIKKKINRKTIYCDIKISINERIVQTKALLDTGNFLKDPISGLPVVIVESNILKRILPYELLDDMQLILNGKNVINIESSNILSKFRIIPFNSLGKENGILLGIKADYVIVFTPEENKIENVIIGIYDGNLTKDGSYSSLISLELLEKTGGLYEFN